MKKAVITQAMIDAYFSRMKDRKFDPNYPFCRICSRVPRDGCIGNIEVNYFNVGETVYEVTYPNGTKGFYHIKCVDDPERMDQKIRVEDILRYDVDKWNGMEDFIKNLLEKKLPDKKAIARIMKRFNCSYTTGWRRLNQFRNRSS